VLAWSAKYRWGEMMVFLKLVLSLTLPISPIFLYSFPKPTTDGVSLELA
jgi:hypothetical protein